jgi:transcriptional regulator with XRE-family HTH domain
MISERLIGIRRAAGLKQTQLANKIGVRRDSYNKYERAGVNPSLEVLTRIAYELNTSTDYLLGITDDPTPPERRVDAFTDGLAVADPSVKYDANGGHPKKINGRRTIISLDADELALITDFRDTDAASKIDICKIAKTLAENARLKMMLKGRPPEDDIEI